MTPLTFVFNEIRRSFGYVFNNLHRYFKPASNRSQNLHLSVTNPAVLNEGAGGPARLETRPATPAVSRDAITSVLGMEVTRPAGDARGRVPLEEGGQEGGRAGTGALVLVCLSAPKHQPVLFLSNFPHMKSGFFITQFWSVIKH